MTTRRKKIRQQRERGSGRPGVVIFSNVPLGGGQHASETSALVQHVKVIAKPFTALCPPLPSPTELARFQRCGSSAIPTTIPDFATRTDVYTFIWNPPSPDTVAMTVTQTGKLVTFSGEAGSQAPPHPRNAGGTGLYQFTLSCPKGGACLSMDWTYDGKGHSDSDFLIASTSFGVLVHETGGHVASGTKTWQASNGTYDIATGSPTQAGGAGHSPGLEASFTLPEVRCWACSETTAPTTFVNTFSLPAFNGACWLVRNRCATTVDFTATTFLFSAGLSGVAHAQFMMDAACALSIASECSFLEITYDVDIGGSSGTGTVYIECRGVFLSMGGVSVVLAADTLSAAPGLHSVGPGIVGSAGVSDVPLFAQSGEPFTLLFTAVFDDAAASSSRTIEISNVILKGWTNA